MANIQDEDALALELALKNEIEYIRSDMPTSEFIDEYVYIENKDNPGTPIIKFDMWDSQRTALQEIIDSKLSITLKARQLGFTWLVLSLIVHLCIKFEGYSVIVLSETEPKTMELINRLALIFSQLPKWLMISAEEFKQYEKTNGKGSYEGLYYDKKSLSIEIRQKGKISSTIKAQPATEGAGASLTADLVFFDEWALHKFAKGIFTAAYPTMARPDSGKFIGLSTNRRGTLFENIWKNAASMGFHKIFRNCFADPRRTQDWYEEQKRVMREKVEQEFPKTEEEALRAGDNVSFPEWSEEIHVCKPFPIPSHWRKFACLDNGYNDPYYWGKMAISEDGTVYLYYEQTRWRSEAQVPYSDQARIFNASLYSSSDGNGVTKEKLDYIVAGLDAWNSHHRDSNGKSLIDYYRDGGLTSEGFIPAITDRKLRKGTFHEYLKPIYDENTNTTTAKFQVFDTCEYFISIMPELVNDDKNPEVVADLSDIDNCYDSVGYGLISYHVSNSKPAAKEDTRTKQQIHKERITKRSFRNNRRR